mgnify:CR=1 FL=1
MKTIVSTEQAPKAIGPYCQAIRAGGFVFCSGQIALDPGTGQIALLDYVAVEDVGRIINPLTLHGQVMGAVVQGFGAAFSEALVYDKNGTLLVGLDYAAGAPSPASVALLARGHVLVEGVPGLGKTMLVRTVADVVANTGFELVIPDNVPQTVAPTDYELHALRTKVDPDGQLRKKRVTVG